MTTRSTT